MEPSWQRVLMGCLWMSGAQSGDASNKEIFCCWMLSTGQIPVRARGSAETGSFANQRKRGMRSENNTCLKESHLMDNDLQFFLQMLQHLCWLLTLTELNRRESRHVTFSACLLLTEEKCCSNLTNAKNATLQLPRRMQLAKNAMSDSDLSAT